MTLIVTRSKDGYKRSFPRSCRWDTLALASHIIITDERTIEAFKEPGLVSLLIPAHNFDINASANIHPIAYLRLVMNNG